MMNKKIEIDQFELRTLMDTHAKALQDLLWEPAADKNYSARSAVKRLAELIELLDDEDDLNDLDEKMRQYTVIKAWQ